MSVPAKAVAGAVLLLLRSATRWAVVVSLHDALPILVSSVALVAATVAVLTIGPVATGLMCTVMVKGWGELAPSEPKQQVTVPAALVHHALAETKLTCTGRTSVTAPPLEVEGPLFVTVGV